MSMIKQALCESITPELQDIKREVVSTRGDIQSMCTRIDAIEHRLEHYDELQNEVRDLRQEVVRLRAAPAVMDPELKAQLKRELADELHQLLSERDARDTREKPYSVQPPAAPAANTRVEFIPDKLFIKGFCEYSPDGANGKSEAECKIIFKLCFAHLPREFHRYVQEDGVRCGYRRNHQVVILLRNNPAKAVTYELVQAWNKNMRDKNVNFAGKKIWVQADAPEFVKQKRRLMAKALAACREELDTSGGELVPEWPTFSLWWARDGNDEKLGWASSTCEWTWCRDAVVRLWPQADVDALSERASLK
jgi:hypothetical protein